MLIKRKRTKPCSLDRQKPAKFTTIETEHKDMERCFLFLSLFSPPPPKTPSLWSVQPLLDVP
jgi:hypothetical protein